MTYFYLKALHIAAMVIWLGGMMAFSLCGSLASRAFAVPLRILFGRLVTPAMALTWVAGISLAYMGNWFNTGLWPWSKMLGAVMLSAMHGLIAGRLTRKALHPKQKDPFLAWLGPAVIFAVMVLQIFIAVTKMF